MLLKEKLTEFGYSVDPAPLVVLDRFHSAVRCGDLVFTSGQIPVLGDEKIQGKVGGDIDLVTAQRAAEICTVNCLRAVAAVTDLENVVQVVKVFGMVNVADGFNDTSSVINGCSELLTKLFGEVGTQHARSAVGMVLPGDWAVEIDMVVAVR
jgi:enamine deaminase RidA (YjgF/YER057c/UK114 family)